jgi:hypothetical protein
MNSNREKGREQEGDIQQKGAGGKHTTEGGTYFEDREKERRVFSLRNLTLV